MMDLYTISVLGIPLLFVVQGSVELVKEFGVKGKALLGSSMAIGLILGSGYQIAVNGLPVEFSGIFGVIVYGLGLGIVASKVYDANNSKK